MEVRGSSDTPTRVFRWTLNPHLFAMTEERFTWKRLGKNVCNILCRRDVLQLDGAISNESPDVIVLGIDVLGGVMGRPVLTIKRHRS